MSICIWGMTLCCSCSYKTDDIYQRNVTEETQKTYAKLVELSSQHQFMFGHHDDTLYGIGWEGEEGRSDVKDVCGDYPAVISFDLGELELGNTQNLDKVPFSRIKKEIMNQYQRGGIISLSWHVRNPLTGGDAWDVSDSTTVHSILPGNDNHKMFMGWLDYVASFINSLKTPDGTKIPILFRPWHEHTGSWFWWEKELCSSKDYKTLWRMTVDSLQAKGVDNALYTYSSSSGLSDTIQYLERYPGDDVIDVLGFDVYQSAKKSFVADLRQSLSVLEEVGRSHNKPIAITETGYEGIPDPTWWTGTLLPVIKDYPISYVLVWRNAREKENHFYAPYPGHMSEQDFVKFYNDPKTLFAKDIKK